MPQPLYFDPDPEIPESELLGYGDLIMDDGTRQFVNGDPELAAMIPRMPEQVDTTTGPGARLPEGIKIGMDGNIQLDNGSGLGVTAVGANAPLGGAQTSGAPPPIMGEPALAAAVTEQAPELLPQEPRMPEPDPLPAGVKVGMDGSITMDGGGSSGSGMVPYQREGALPPEVANRQASELSAANDATLQAEQQARADEVRIEREAGLKEMARLKAQRDSEEDKIREQQEKGERWRKEQTETEQTDIKTGLVEARGGLGAMMAVIGAALVKGDSGLRMIDQMIDRSVKNQIDKRDSKLNRLAKQLGSSEQAIAAGKAASYKLAADMAEQTVKLTKADVYEKQSPAVIAGLRQKQLEKEQEQERISLGKLIERAPTPAKGADPKMLEAYGKLRRDRIASGNIASRAEQQIGLVWDPAKGDYANKAEALKKGVQGVGAMEQWVPDFVYSTMGGMTAEGYQVRGAAEAMAYAQIRQMQPVGPISNADIQAAVKAGALNTEAGLVEGLRRIRLNDMEQERHDAAQYGPDVVGEYNRLYRGSGGQSMSSSPAASREATPDDIRRELKPKGSGNTAEDALKSQGLLPGKAPATTSSAIPEDPKERMATIAGELQGLASEELPPEGLAILVAQAGHETADGARMPQGNFFGHKASAKSKASGRGSANLETTEGEGTGAQRVKQDFATFNNATESAADHISLLKRKYPLAWEALQAGDESAYVAALKDGGYFTGNESEYLKGIQRRL